MQLVFTTDKTGEFPQLLIDVRLIQQHQQWSELCDLVSALKLSLQCGCHVEVGPLQKTCENLATLYPQRPIQQITVQPQTWQVKATTLPDLAAYDAKSNTL